MRRKIGIGLVVICFLLAAVGLIVTEDSGSEQVQTTTIFTTPLPAGGTLGLHRTVTDDNTPEWWLLAPLAGIATGVVLLLWPYRREGRINSQHRSAPNSGGNRSECGG
jgi:hypothetical protein